MFEAVLTKRDFARRFLEGEFGNRTASWQSAQELETSDYPDLVHLRNGKTPGGVTHYSISREEAIRFWRDKEDQADWYCSAMIPERVLTSLQIQGEVYESTEGLALYYSTIPKPMRDSLREGGKQCYRTEAIMRLRYFLDPDDYDWIRELLDRYDGHVVEFSHYAIKCGTLNKRMIVWEVRRY